MLHIPVRIYFCIPNLLLAASRETDRAWIIEWIERCKKHLIVAGYKPTVVTVEHWHGRDGVDSDADWHIVFEDMPDDEVIANREAVGSIISDT